MLDTNKGVLLDGNQTPPLPVVDITNSIEMK
jgi:hypothetical protein